MIEGRDLHNLFSEILGYKLLVRKNTYYVIKTFVKSNFSISLFANALP